MLIGRLKINDTVASGVTVTAIRRDGAYSEITFSTGATRRVHKTRHVADLGFGHITARSLDRRAWVSTRDVRASSPEWRGEKRGQRGEKVIERFPSYDSRAVTEQHHSM